LARHLHHRIPDWRPAEDKSRPLWMTNDKLDKPAIIILHDDLADDQEFIAALYSLARQHFEGE
jgi:hypothetical protein